MGEIKTSMLYECFGFGLKMLKYFEQTNSGVNGRGMYFLPYPLPLVYLYKEWTLCLIFHLHSQSIPLCYAFSRLNKKVPLVRLAVSTPVLTFSLLFVKQLDSPVHLPSARTLVKRSSDSLGPMTPVSSVAI